MQFYEINICQVMIFRLSTVYNKHGAIKIVNQTREKLHGLSQVLEKLLLSTVGNNNNNNNKTVEFDC